MNFFRPIGIAGLAWRDAGRGFTRGYMWVPVVALAGLELLILAILLWFYLPPLVAWARPLVNLLGGESSTHYPAHLYAMPRMFGQLSVVTRILALPIVCGILCTRFAELFRISFQDAPASLTVATTLRLIAVGFVATALPYGIEAMILGALDSGAEPVAWMPVLLALITILSVALFLYCVPAIALQGLGLIGAVREALRAARRSPVPTLLVTSVSLAVLFPFTVLVPRSDLQALSLRPEFSVVLVLLRIVLQAVILFLIIGASTRLYAPRRSRRR